MLGLNYPQLSLASGGLGGTGPCFPWPPGAPWHQGCGDGQVRPASPQRPHIGEGHPPWYHYRWALCPALGFLPLQLWSQGTNSQDW